MSTRRKFRPVTAALLVMGLAVALLPSGTALAASPPVGDWRMEENGGTVLVDSSASANNGTILGNPTWVAGQHGLALRSDGIGDYATVPDSASLDVTSAITMATWVRPEKTAFATQNLIKKAVTAGSTVNGYELSLSAPGKVFVRFNQASNGDTFRLNSTTSYPLNGSAWMHVAATYDGTTMRLYVNGLQEASLAASFTIGTNALNLGIGAQPDGASQFQGALDDTLVYNSALTPAEIATLAGVTPPNTPPALDPVGNKTAGPDVQLAFTATASDPDVSDVLTFTLADGTGEVPAGAAITSGGAFTWTPTVGQLGLATFDVCVSDGTVLDCETIGVTVTSDGLVGDWKADEGSGPTLVDDSGLANDGTIAGDPTWVAGQHGQAIRLDGTGDHATVTDNASVDITNAITMAAWVKPEADTTQNLIKKAVNDATDGYELSLSSQAAGQNVFVRFNQDTSVNLYRINSSTTYPTDGSTWVHAAATYDGATIRLYVNGVLDGSLAGPASIATNALNLRIGASPDGVFPLTGTLDDVLLYNRALSPSEIAALASITPPNSPPVLDPIGNKNLQQDEVLAFTATATDPDLGDTLTFSLDDGTSGTVPPGASITAGGAFTWTPSAPQVATFDVCVSDGTDTDCETITVTVTAAPAPGPLKDDFDADGRSDLLWRHATTGENYLWFMNGTALDHHGPTLTLPDTDWKVMGTGDFDGDADADIVWRNTATDRVDVWLMDGTTVVSSAPVFTLDPTWKLVGTGDFDGDAKADILWRNATTGENYLWFMDGTTLASHGPTLGLADLDWKVVGTGDFNGDANADIAWRNTSTDQVYVWLMDGTTLLSHGAVFTLDDANWTLEGTGDYNGNGKDDLLWQHSGTGEVYVWLMNGTSLASSGSVFTLGDPDWDVAGTGDYDGDGKADIAWRNASTGEVYVWLMNGTTLVSSGSTFTLADSDWQIVPTDPPSGTLFRAVPDADRGAQMSFTVTRRGAPTLSAPEREPRWWHKIRSSGPRTRPPTRHEMTWTVGE